MADEELSFRINVDAPQRGPARWEGNGWKKEDLLGGCVMSPCLSSRSSAVSPDPSQADPSAFITNDAEEQGFDAYESSDASSLDSSLFGPSSRALP